MIGLEEFTKKFSTSIEGFMQGGGYGGEDFRRLVNKARLYHEPMNWKGDDRRKELLDKIGHHETFADALNREGVRNRFYFFFKERDLSTFYKTALEFNNCGNFKKYAEVWKHNAPIEINSTVVYLYALADMTYQGMKNERDKIVAFDLIETSGEEDYYKGVDALTRDGRKVNIKSAATLRGMRDEDRNGVLFL